MQTLRPSVLVVEDDAAVRELVSETLREEGYAVVEARDGREAIYLIDGDLSRAARPAIVLLDVRLPLVDGISVLDYLAARDERFPVVAMSASHAYLDSARSAGASHTLAKPFELDDLVNTVAAYCTSHQ